ncbi:MAG: NAD(P)H-quinone oxidoreductase [Myxococcaceae bacterium]|nr:NAD(P)H-quinone oxidoreductase [Myxococcaceae bacterium]
MKALVITGAGGPEVLQLREVPRPTPGAWEVAVRVHAAALNRADLLQLRGAYPAPVGAVQDVPGLEYAGEVVAVGAHVTRFRVGDRVMGLVGGGAFAEFLTTHEREAVRIPGALAFEHAAAIPEAFVTAYDALVLQGGLRSGEAVLIHAAASGVGTAAVQIVRAHGAVPIGTARTAAKLDRLGRELGLEHRIVVGADARFAEAVKALTGGGAHLALELVGGAYLPETVAAMAPRGRILLVGLSAGAKAEIDLRQLLNRRVQLIGTVLRSRPAEEKIAAAQALERHLVPLFETHALRPVIDSVFRFDEAAQAFARLSDNRSIGKIVLRW